MGASACYGFIALEQLRSVSVFFLSYCMIRPVVTCVWANGSCSEEQAVIIYIMRTRKR